MKLKATQAIQTQVTRLVGRKMKHYTGTAHILGGMSVETVISKRIHMKHGIQSHHRIRSKFQESGSNSVELLVTQNGRLMPQMATIVAALGGGDGDASNETARSTGRRDDIDNMVMMRTGMRW